LDGLVLAGSHNTCTDALYLTDSFINSKLKTSVIAVPCNIDNSVGHHMVEANVGFDTATKVYA
jgi:pyrophosphate--fructose-6-phosphate 1-phosphotransferase